MTTLISDHYVKQNAALHAVGNYGVSGHKWAQTLADMVSQTKLYSIIDYGCGQRTLQKAFDALCDGHEIADWITWQNYDPAIPELSDHPDPAAIVVCGDVLEHVEPECLEAVLDDIESLAQRVVFFVIATRPAKKILPDGRNAHLIQQPYDWWIPKLAARWSILNFHNEGGEFMVMGMTK